MKKATQKNNKAAKKVPNRGEVPPLFLVPPGMLHYTPGPTRHSNPPLRSLLVDIILGNSPLKGPRLYLAGLLGVIALSAPHILQALVSSCSLNEPYDSWCVRMAKDIASLPAGEDILRDIVKRDLEREAKNIVFSAFGKEAVQLTDVS